MAVARIWIRKRDWGGEDFVMHVAILKQGSPDLEERIKIEGLKSAGRSPSF